MPPPVRPNPKAFAAATKRFGIKGAGTKRDILQQIGRKISPTFDVRLHLSDGKPPRTGSFLTETFTGSGTLQAHTSDSGHSWERHPVSTEGTLELKEGFLINAGDSKAPVYRSSAAPLSVDYDLAWSVSMPSTSNGHGSVWARLDASAQTGYRFASEALGGTETRHRIYKYVAGVNTVLGSKNTANGNFSCIAEIRDPIKRFYRNGEVIVTSTDNVVTGAGGVGVHTAFATSPTGSGFYIDSLTATDVIAPRVRQRNGKETVGGTLTPELAETPKAGNILLVGLGFRGSVTSPPSGFTEIKSGGLSRLWAKIAGSEEPKSASLTIANSGRAELVEIEDPAGKSWPDLTSILSAGNGPAESGALSWTGPPLEPGDDYYVGGLLGIFQVVSSLTCSEPFVREAGNTARCFEWWSTRSNVPTKYEPSWAWTGTSVVAGSVVFAIPPPPAEEGEEPADIESGAATGEGTALGSITSLVSFGGFSSGEGSGTGTIVSLVSFIGSASGVGEISGILEALTGIGLPHICFPTEAITLNTVGTDAIVLPRETAQCTVVLKSSEALVINPSQSTVSVLPAEITIAELTC